MNHDSPAADRECAQWYFNADEVITPARAWFTSIHPCGLLVGHQLRHTQPYRALRTGTHELTTWKYVCQ